MTYDRDDVACHNCFEQKALKDWIKSEGTERGICPWCGRRGVLVPLEKLGDTFRDVANLYAPVEGPDAYREGEWISFLLDDNWGVFSDLLHADDRAQQLAVTILYAGVDPKERGDYPDYEGFFRNKEPSSLEENWDQKANDALTGDPTAFDKADALRIESELADVLPDQMTVAFEDLSTSILSSEVARTRTRRTICKA